MCGPLTLEVRSALRQRGGVANQISPRILVAYHSAEGQTARTAERIASVLRAGGATVVATEVTDAPSPAGFDGVIAGDSIHAGRHSRQLTRWIAAHLDELETMPVALFQVSLTSASDDDQHAAEAHRLLHLLLDSTGLSPDMVGLFAGALAYTRYGWFKRRLMRNITAKEGGDTDTSKDHEYTDWDAVEHFATDALALITATAPDRARSAPGEPG